VNTSSNDDEVKDLAIQNLLLTEFSDNLTSEIYKEKPATILMEEDNGDLVSLEFLNNQMQMTSKIDITRTFSNTFYVDNPFILEGDYFLYSTNSLSYLPYKHRQHLSNCIHNVPGGINYFDEVMQNKKVMQIFSNVIDGDVKIGPKGYRYHTNKFAELLNMENVSTGIKSFAIIKLLLEKGFLKDSEFLILDEPEIHLHPEWQLRYAELIVLLSIHYPVRIVITSHSPYFVEAIELYSKKHKIDDQVRYYKTEMESFDGLSKIVDVTGQIEKLYEDMAIPFRKLAELREELDES